MSEYDDIFGEEKKGIGSFLRMINNQPPRSEQRGTDGASEKTRLVTLQHLQEEKEILNGFERVGTVCRGMNMVKHGKKHAEYVAKTAGEILKRLGFSSREVHLGEIAGYLHDLGYRLDIERHSLISSGMAYEILDKMGMAQNELDKVCLAIAYHNEKPDNKIGAALAIAEASDFSKLRVREDAEQDKLMELMSKCTKNELVIDEANKIIRLELSIDFSVGVSKQEFIMFEKSKQQNCKASAEVLGCRYEVKVNGEIVF